MKESSFLGSGFDTDLLGLKFELISYLGEHDINWFVDFTDVEADLSNREIKLTVMGIISYKDQVIYLHWGMKNGFVTQFLDDGSVRFKRETSRR